MYVFYHKVVFLILSRFTNNFPPEMPKEYKYNINISDNNFNLVSFTIETFDIKELKTLLLNFNNPNAISEFHFLSSLINTSPNFLSLFNEEGELFVHCEFIICKPDNKDAELGFDNFVVCLSKEILKSCVYETMKKNASTNKYKFYVHISNNNILEY